MATTGSTVANFLESNYASNSSLSSEVTEHSLHDSNAYQSQASSSSILENASVWPSCQISVIPEMTALGPLQTLSTTQSTMAGSSPNPEFYLKEAAPLPRQVGEIAHGPRAAPILPSDVVVRNLSSATTRDDDAFTYIQPLGAVHTASSWSPVLTSSYSHPDHVRGGHFKPREKISVFEMFWRTVLLVLLGLFVLIITLVGFLQVQRQIKNSNDKKYHATSILDIHPDLENQTGAHSSNSSDAASMGNTNNNNASFVYLGTIFIVALLIEFWVFVCTLRRLYYRLGLWVDQEYPILLPDLSDPDAIIPPKPVLPFWARILAIKPRVVRPPLLPPYMAVLNMIRTGGRSEMNAQGTGDVEDGEVIRTLAMGHGQAAPAFNGEEFKKSTIILSGPPKRSSSSSVSPSVHSTGGLFRNFSKSFTSRLNSRNSPTTYENQVISSSCIPSGNSGASSV